MSDQIARGLAISAKKKAESIIGSGDTVSLEFTPPLTLPAGSQVQLTNLGTTTNSKIQLEIPRGEDGRDGAQGPQGVQGIQGPMGPKGDVGATGPAGERGRGVFSIVQEDGNLYYISDDGVRNPLEYDETTGELWYVVDGNRELVGVISSADNHAQLRNLDYENSGHTGFASIAALETKANVGPTPTYTLPITSEFQSSTLSVYSKNQFGEVIVNIGGALINPPVPGANVVIATLPIGFWPPKNVVFPLLTGSDPGRLTATGSISATGNITVATISSAFYYGGISFVAQSQ